MRITYVCPRVVIAVRVCQRHNVPGKVIPQSLDVGVSLRFTDKL